MKMQVKTKNINIAEAKEILRRCDEEYWWFDSDDALKDTFEALEELVKAAKNFQNSRFEIADYSKEALALDTALATLKL